MFENNYNIYVKLASIVHLDCSWKARDLNKVYLSENALPSTARYKIMFYIEAHLSFQKDLLGGLSQGYINGSRLDTSYYLLILLIITVHTN